MKTFLWDSANATISGLSLSAANYVQAIELLKDRYGNSQVLISAYMKKFVLLPKIKNNDDIKGLRNLYDQVESSVWNLQILKVDTNSCDSLLVLLVNKKLPTDICVIIIARKFATQVRHECYTNDTSATWVLHQRHECDTSATRVKKFGFVTKRPLYLLYGKWETIRRGTTSF